MLIVGRILIKYAAHIMVFYDHDVTAIFRETPRQQTINFLTQRLVHK